MIRFATLGVLALALVNCTKDVPDWCSANDMSRCGAGQVCNVATQTCESTGNQPDAAACSATMACPAGQFCEVAAGACHDCGGLASPGQSADLCTDPAAPVCDGFACRRCEADAECDSSACRHDGTCAAAATIIYAAPQLAGAGDCSSAADPCDVYEAVNTVDATRNVIRLAPGTYNLDNGRLNIAETTILLGREAIIRRNASLGPVVETMNAADLTVEFATIRDGAGVGSDGDGIICNSGTTLTLRAATIESCDEAGIDANNCTLSIEGSTFSANQGGGISSTGGSLTVSGSTFSANQGGGIFSTNGSFDITNSLIVRNGNNAAQRGGLDISSTMPSRLLFNTIADNEISTLGPPGGVDCAANMVTSGFNLLYRNRIDSNITAPAQHNNAACIGASSVVELTAGAIMFASETPPYDYHLTAGSPATVKNAAGATCAVTTDVDGQARPNEGGCDIGADEYYPGQ